MPDAATTMLARDTIHWSMHGGEGSENRAMGSAAPVGRKNNGSVRQPSLLFIHGGDRSDLARPTLNRL
eukprot:6311118-Alexandrium_andersonii.AAC.1